jgi:microcompartment protein CcmK/EutM
MSAMTVTNGSSNNSNPNESNDPIDSLVYLIIDQLTGQH